MNNKCVPVLVSIMVVCLPISAAAGKDDDAVETVGEFGTGLEVAEAIVREYGVVTDREWVDKVNRVGYNLAARLENRRMPFVFNTVKIDEANAFALPGGFIFITEGMRRMELTEDELGHLLGHEMAHSNLRHLVKMQRKAGILNVLHHALLAGILFGMHDQSSVDHGPSGPAPYQGDEGKVAAFEGALLFGQVLRDLLQRGYTREIEYEADRIGFSYAVAAGYTPEAGEALLEKLHNHFYEAPGMHYWRTHPYFHDRVRLARARVKTQPHTLQPADCAAGRDELQAHLVTLAEKQVEPGRKMLLMQAALEVDPTSTRAIALHRFVLLGAQAGEEKKASFLREYGRLIELYDRAIDLLEKSPEATELRAELGTNRTMLEQARDSEYHSYESMLDAGLADVDSLERFLINYPDSPRRSEVLFLLGRNHNLLEKPDEAVEFFLQAIHRGGGDEWAQQAEKSLAVLIPKLDDLCACQRIVDDCPGLREVADERLKCLVSSFEDMGCGSRFLTLWPQSGYAEVIKGRLNVLGEREYQHGRQYEAIAQFQKAMDAYNRVIETVPSDELLERTYGRMDAIQQRAENEPA